ncbi:glutathione peroxidase [Corynebacterium halotolerans]|uniref:Glutathione peroxidase n=1 Tax=Corynebacterium halotolerans YIM 70093 = DSM 44683 TaxID=1121362 RepID=M1N087_9CORY|nr:glutathione peroxidase [Corynebacterium halotolerans]AGF73379.1 glutathione peroxidase [Corynebacterium halotolerans YIM 70093 = DSM 44683]
MTDTALTDIQLNLNDATDTTLGDLAPGKLVLIVNTASECGFTPQYEGLQKLQDTYSDRGFTVLGVPCNQFGGQEPGTDEEIKEFCSSSFSVTFPLLSKVEVNGTGAHPLFRQLTAIADAEGEGGDVKWNFEKFLVAPDGEVLGRFRSRTEPQDPQLVELIEENLPG